MRIVITGGTGFVGRRLVRRLIRDGHVLHLLVRPGRTGVGPSVECSVWDVLAGEPPGEALAPADAIVHLAGEPVAQRWTPETKRRIRDSRVAATQRLVAALARLPQRPRVLVCASAVGYYGSRGDEILTEDSSPGRGFLPEVCVAWERAAAEAEALGLRVVRLRIGIVLGPEGGALARMLPPFRLGAGGRLGPGSQWMSWIHVEDLVDLIRFALTADGFRGAVNAVAPNPVRNSEFTETLATVLRRPALVPTPALALRVLFGEMAEAVLLASQRVFPRAAEAAGFSFRYPGLASALRNLLAE
ncbi:MAG: TIGR01777 family oxidoreductase [Bryobacterales bacterium]|nr:TIGR01777 family oxidoreductase [Bryobacteraceae bacterium]MDW8355498.1 TIGR01777 family oxidoreductase [Bryobacterales bacterium]